MCEINHLEVDKNLLQMYVLIVLQLTDKSGVIVTDKTPQMQ